MDGWAEQMKEVVDGIASSVAIVRRGEGNDLLVTACNDKFLEMVEGSRARARGFPFLLDDIIPSYARRELGGKIHECLDSLDPQEIEQAYDLRDGSHWWRLSLKPFCHRPAAGTVREIFLTGIDITPKMLLTQQLETSTSRFRLVVDAAYDAIVTIDHQQRITLFNRAAERLFGYDQAEMLGQPLDVLLPERVRHAHHGHVQHFAQSPVPSRQMEERNLIHGLHRDGSRIPVEIAISKISVNGLTEFTAVIRDITDRVRFMDLLQKQAATDELTSLPNRRSITDTAKAMMRAKDPFALMILDVDHFKRVNDTYGHDRGDEVLCVLAKVGARGLREEGIFARLGGEEFVAVLPGAAAEQARAAAEALRETFERQDFAHEWRGEPVPFTVSIGVTDRTAADRDLGEVLKRADIALYAAKEAGRNRVELR